MSLKTENSRRVAKSRPVCMGLKHRQSFSGLSAVQVTASSKSNYRHQPAMSIMKDVKYMFIMHLISGAVVSCLY